MTQQPISTPARNVRSSRWRRSRWVWIVLAAILATVLVGGTIAALYISGLARSYDAGVTTVPDDQTFPDATLRPEAADTGATNILLLGSDIRGEISDDLEGISGQNSDTIVVMHVPADDSGVQFMSVMRDTWLPLPGFGDAKVNAALSLGGVPLVVQVVEGLIGTRIDHVALIDFSGFEQLTDALGGVTVTNTVDFWHDDIHYPVGDIDLDGREALGFVRERHAFVDGDYQRVRNQQAYLKGVLEKVLTPATLVDPVKVTDIVGSIAPFLTVDAGFDSGTVGALATRLRNVRADDLLFFTAPTAGTGVSADGQSIVLPDEEGFARVAEAFRTDSVAEYAREALSAPQP